jgi:hypothetical protein
VNVYMLAEDEAGVVLCTDVRFVDQTAFRVHWPIEVSDTRRSPRLTPL